MAYESPIQLIFGSIRRQMDDGILKAVQECDIRVDRDELIRALQYDRGQYEKGYADGISAAEKARPVVRGEWVLTDARCAEMSCSVCGFTYYGEWDKECMSKFCPECGADNRGGDDETD